jgi:DNA-binding transcriptional ArsR family regulator
VQQLTAHFAMRRPSLSEHLKVLRDVGLVNERKQGRQRYYYLEPEPLREVQAWLAPYEQFWKNRFTNLETLLAEENPE